MNNLSENLKKIRKDNKLSQEDLAEELGVSRQAISKWESNSAYPEMDKIIQICKKFDLNIDDLLNKDISEVKREKESKINLNKYIDDFLHFISDSINLFSSMRFKAKVKCLFEQLLIISTIIIVLIIIGGIGSLAVESIFSLLPHFIYYRLFHLLAGIYLILSFIISVIILVHIFKVRYLDYYKDIKNKTCDDKEKNNFSKVEDKIIIRDPKHSSYKFINGIFKLLIIFIKFCLLMFSLFLCLLLIGIASCFIMSFLVIKTGIFFIGLVLSTIGMGSACIIVILLILNFIFNRKNNKKIMIWTFILSMIVIGIGLGLTLSGSLKFDIVDDSDLIETKSFNIEMLDNLHITGHNINYIEKDINNIIIQYDINKNCEADYYISNKNNLYFASSCSNEFKMIRDVLKEINQNKLISINDDISNINVYASSENIKKLNP